MDAPPRPVISYDRPPSVLCQHPASTIVQALDDLYQAAFCAFDRNHLMDQAHAAPKILADAIQELLYLRQQIIRAEQARDREGAAKQNRAREQAAAGPRPPDRDELLGDIELYHALFTDQIGRLNTIVDVAHNQAQLIERIAHRSYPTGIGERQPAPRGHGDTEGASSVNPQSSIPNPQSPEST